MPRHQTSAEEPAHDILAAEEFAMPTPDPSLKPAHDVLAADEFAVPAADPELHHGPVVLPDDPTGIEEPHDILAAEEFAMPAGRPGSGAGVRRHSDAVRRIALAGAAGALVVRLLRRRG